MLPLKIEITLEKDGTLTLTDLPLHAGERVEVTIVPRTPAHPAEGEYPLRGKPVTYVDPTEPVQDDWEANL